MWRILVISMLKGSHFSRYLALYSQKNSIYCCSTNLQEDVVHNSIRNLSMLPQLKIIISAEGVMMSSIKDIGTTCAIDLCHSQDRNEVCNQLLNVKASPTFPIPVKLSKREGWVGWLLQLGKRQPLKIDFQWGFLAGIASQLFRQEDSQIINPVCFIFKHQAGRKWTSSVKYGCTSSSAAKL